MQNAVYRVSALQWAKIGLQSVCDAGLGGLPWRTEALEEALLHLDSWSGWFHRSNGREVVRTLIAEASPTELNHMVSPKPSIPPVLCVLYRLSADALCVEMRPMS